MVVRCLLRISPGSLLPTNSSRDPLLLGDQRLYSWFDGVYGGDSSVSDSSVSESFATDCSKFLVNSALGGECALFFCFGAASSGKTISNLGTRGDSAVLPFVLQTLLDHRHEIPLVRLDVAAAVISLDGLVSDVHSNSLVDGTNQVTWQRFFSPFIGTVTFFPSLRVSSRVDVDVLHSRILR